MKRLQQEQGYTLVLTLGIFVIFIIIGASLMTLTVNGVKKNENRENNIQSRDLSIKGQDLLVKTLEYEMNSYLQNGRNATEYQVELERIMNSYKCPTTNLITDSHEKKLNINNLSTLPAKMKQSGDTGNYYYCILNWHNEVIDSKENPYRKVVKIQSVGDSNKEVADHLYHTETTRKIGSNLMIEPFYYVISTHKDAANYKAGDGNITLNGAIGITGNMNIANDLNTTYHPIYKNMSIDSLLPIVKNSNTQIKGKMVVNGSTASTIHSLFQPALSLGVTKVNHELMEDRPFKVDELVQAHQVFFKKQAMLPTDVLGADATSFNTNSQMVHKSINSSIPYTYYRSNAADDFTAASKWNWLINSNSNTFKNIYFPKNLEIRYFAGGEGYGKKTLTVDSAYVGGNMHLGFLDGFDNVFTNTDQYFSTDGFTLTTSQSAQTNIELNGDYYINGDVYITNVKLSGNFNLYVNGKVNIYFSTFNNTNGNIFSEGRIYLGYISNQGNPPETRYYPDGRVKTEVDTSDPNAAELVDRSIWNGYFYSNSFIQFDSPTSYALINGGFHGKQVILSSTRGRSRESCNALAHNKREFKDYAKAANGKLYTNCFDNIDNQKMSSVTYHKLLPTSAVSSYSMPMYSRLELKYDANFINNYLQKKRIYNISTSTVTELKVIQ